MQQRTKHKILGSFVVLALVVILLPLFQKGKELPLERVAVKAPAFPDQAMKVAMNDEKKVLLTDEHPTDASPTDETKGATQPDVPTNLVTSQNKSPPTSPVKLTPVVQPESPKNVVAFKRLESTLVNVMPKTMPVSNLKQHTWVVQMGSFKNKSNALRLLNQLRAKGYTAFMQQTDLASDANATRVFIGPENQHEKAQQLAALLENQLHIKGVVVNYQPLVL